MSTRSVTKREKALMAGGIAIGVIVAGVSARTSYGHISEVSQRVGEEAHGWIPVSVDGMMLAGAAMSAVDRLRGYAPRGWATVSLWLGTMMTVAFNVTSAWSRGAVASAVALVPAVALVVTVEALFKPSRRLLAMVRETLAAPAVVAAEPQTGDTAPVPTPEPVDVPASTTDAGTGAGTDGTGTPPTVQLAGGRARPRKRAPRPPRPRIVPIEQAEVTMVDDVHTVPVG